MCNIIGQLNILLEQLKKLTWFACNLSTHQKSSLSMALLAQISPYHISKRLAKNNRLIAVANVEPLSPLPSRSMTFSTVFQQKELLKTCLSTNNLFLQQFTSSFWTQSGCHVALLTMPNRFFLNFLFCNPRHCED